MTDRLIPSTLREVRGNLTTRPAIVGMLALGIILGISGPFDTLNQIAALPRTLYWTMVVAVTFATGSFTGALVHESLMPRNEWLIIALSTAAIGVTVTVMMTILNLALFGIWPITAAEMLNQLGIVTMIAAVVQIGSYALRTPSKSEAKPVALLERLPLEKRGPLVSLIATFLQLIPREDLPYNLLLVISTWMVPRCNRGS